MRVRLTVSERNEANTIRRTTVYLMQVLIAEDGTMYLIPPMSHELATDSPFSVDPLEPSDKLDLPTRIKSYMEDWVECLACGAHPRANCACQAFGPDWAHEADLKVEVV